MLGIPDPWVWGVYFLSIASALVCLAWGFLFWNVDEPSGTPVGEVKRWAEEEDKLEEEL